MPRRPRSQALDTPREQIRGLNLLPNSELAELLGIPLDAVRELFRRRERLLKRLQTVQLQAEPVEQLAGAWAENNLPAEDLAGILKIAREAFDDGDKAVRWLQEPNIQTGNRPPVSLIGSPEGFAAVESVLRQIQYAVIG